MSTRTIISARMRGKVYSIYCHHDGYPEHIIPLLRGCYNTQEKIEALIMLGDTSAIHETLDKCSPYADGTKDGEPYEDNAPTVAGYFEPHEGFLYEYFWNGEFWEFIDRTLKPITEWRELASTQVEES